MAIFLTANEEISNRYPSNRKYLSRRLVSILSFKIKKTLEIIELSNSEKPTLKVWYNIGAQPKKLLANKELSKISFLYKRRNLNNDILEKGNVQCVFEKTKINPQQIKFSPIKINKK